MRLSTKGEYASRAMLELSLRYHEGALHIRDISKSQHIPERFLEQILLLLKRAGYLRSKKGQGGGYFLSKPPSEISVAEVIRVMDGPLAPIACASRTAYEPCRDCRNVKACTIRLTMLRVRDAMSDVLDRLTVADMAAMGEGRNVAPMDRLNRPARAPGVP